jgi:hypothetical protein
MKKIYSIFDKFGLGADRGAVASLRATQCRGGDCTPERSAGIDDTRALDIPNDTPQKGLNLAIAALRALCLAIGGE